MRLKDKVAFISGGARRWVDGEPPLFGQVGFHTFARRVSS